jgi:hypothetical protein
LAIENQQLENKTLCKRTTVAVGTAHELAGLDWMNSVQDTAFSLSRSLDTQKVGHLSEYLRHSGEDGSKIEDQLDLF